MLRFFSNLYWAYQLRCRESIFTWDRRIVFVARSLYYPKASNTWYSYLRTSYLLECPLTINDVVEQLHRPYYDFHISAYDKVLLLISHFETMKRLFGEKMAADIINKKCLIFSEFLGKGGCKYQITLSQEVKFNREGNLTFSLVTNDEILISIAFTINNVDGRNQILIGCVQATSDDPADKLRAATHDLYGIQPRILLVNLVRILCDRFKFESIEAVGSENHIYRSIRYKRKIKIHMVYDELWKLMDGHMVGNGNFSIPVPIPRKPIESYPSKKRSEHRHRYQLMDAIASDSIRFF